MAELDATQIQALIPHRYPFLLVDRIVELDPGKRAVGLKHVSMSDQYLQGHFPSYPVMPGVLIVEALAQTGSVAALSLPENKQKLGLFAGLNNVRFKRPVVPGDTLRLEVEFDKIRMGIGRGKGVATVNGQLACEGELMFALVNRIP